MRRITCLLLVMLCVAASAAAEQGAERSMSMETVGELMKLQPLLPDEKGSFHMAGDWVSMIGFYPEDGHTQWRGIVYDAVNKVRVAWDDVFADADAAAARLVEIAEASDSGNVYAEDAGYDMLPRDSFVIARDQLTVMYPFDMVQLVSGHSGAISVFAFEVGGLVKEGVPLAVGDAANAAAALQSALETGTLGGIVSDYPIGGEMARAAEALRLSDTPDLTREEAVYRFDAPMMRGIFLLSAKDDDDPDTATITGQFATRFDFSGLCTGVATKDDCVAALGPPARTETVAGSDAYDRLPDGETLAWTGNGNALALHFVDGALHSVTLAKEQ